MKKKMNYQKQPGFRNFLHTKYSVGMRNPKFFQLKMIRMVRADEPILLFLRFYEAEFKQMKIENFEQ